MQGGIFAHQKSSIVNKQSSINTSLTFLWSF
jgi:hypothetical protein